MPADSNKDEQVPPPLAVDDDGECNDSLPS